MKSVKVKIHRYIKDTINGAPNHLCTPPILRIVILNFYMDATGIQYKYL